VTNEAETQAENDSLFEAPPMGEQERMVEAILFASAEPISTRELASRMPHGSDPAEALVYLRKRYEGRGVQLVKVDDAWAFRTAGDLGFLMQKETVEKTPATCRASKSCAPQACWTTGPCRGQMPCRTRMTRMKAQRVRTNCLKINPHMLGLTGQGAFQAPPRRLM